MAVVAVRVRCKHWESLDKCSNPQTYKPEVWKLKYAYVDNCNRQPEAYIRWKVVFRLNSSITINDANLMPSFVYSTRTNVNTI